MVKTPEITADDYAIYIKLSDSQIIESEEVLPKVYCDYDKDGNVVSIEILNYKNINQKQ